jgi:hypothetical protein
VFSLAFLAKLSDSRVRWLRLALNLPYVMLTTYLLRYSIIFQAATMMSHQSLLSNNAAATAAHASGVRRASEKYASPALGRLPQTQV